jgi:hypothetical protein
VHQVEVVAVVLALLGQMGLELMAVMVEQGQTPIQLGLLQQVQVIVAITLVAGAVERKTIH